MVNGQIIGVGLALLVIGLTYDQLVAHMERRGYDRGYRGLMVVPVVLAGLAIASLWIGGDAAVVATLCLGVIGGPPIAGDVLRYMRHREGDEASGLGVSRQTLREVEAIRVELAALREQMMEASVETSVEASDAPTPA